MPDSMTKVKVQRLQKLGQKKTFTVVLDASVYVVPTDLAKVLEDRGKLPYFSAFLPRY
jgi:hypothetical protein